MADTWHAVNKEFLQFREAAVKRIMELENKRPEYETRDSSSQTDLTHDGYYVPPQLAPVRGVKMQNPK